MNTFKYGTLEYSYDKEGYLYSLFDPQDHCFATYHALYDKIVMYPADHSRGFSSHDMQVVNHFIDLFMTGAIK